MHRPPLPPRNIRARVDRRAIARPEDLSEMKNSNELIGGQTRVLWPLMIAKNTETDFFSRSILMNVSSTE